MKTTINKELLVDRIAEETEFTKKDSKIFLEGLIKVIGTALQSDEKVVLVNFLTLETRDVAEKSGVCMGKEYTTEAHKVVKFKAGKGLLDTINTKEEEF